MGEIPNRSEEESVDIAPEQPEAREQYEEQQRIAEQQREVGQRQREAAKAGLSAEEQNKLMQEQMALARKQIETAFGKAPEAQVQTEKEKPPEEAPMSATERMKKEIFDKKYGRGNYRVETQGSGVDSIIKRLLGKK